MQPSETFWDGVGEGFAQSPGWMVVGTVLVIGSLFVVAKYIYPGYKEIRMKREENEREVKMRELDIRERDADNDGERIKANAALAENMRGLRESNDRLAEQSAALFAGIEESKTRSRAMGDDMSHVRATTDHTAEQVDELHRHFLREGTD